MALSGPTSGHLDFQMHERFPQAQFLRDLVPNLVVYKNPIPAQNIEM